MASPWVAGSVGSQEEVGEEGVWARGEDADLLVCLDAKISHLRVRGPRAHTLRTGCFETPGACLKIVSKVSEPLGLTGNECLIQEFPSFLSHVMCGSDLVLTDTVSLPQVAGLDSHVGVRLCLCVCERWTETRTKAGTP